MPPGGSQLSGALRITVVARSRTVPPSLAMPPAAEAVLRVTRLPRMTRWPWLARPPPVAAELNDTVLPITVALACGLASAAHASPAPLGSPAALHPAAPRRGLARPAHPPLRQASRLATPPGPRAAPAPRAARAA